MKKIIMVILLAGIIIIGLYWGIISNKDIDKVLSKFETYESDGYYDNKNNIEASGYIVSNKTSEGYRYGYVNYKGDILLEAEYNQIYRVMNIENKDKVYLIAAKNGRYGVSLNGKNIINYEYQYIDYNKEIDSFILQKTESYGVANIDGKIIIPVNNEFVEIKGKNIYVTNKEGNKVYDREGKEQQIDFNTSIEPTENEKYFIKITEKEEQYFYGIIDKNGKDLVDNEYTYIEYLYDEYFIACNKDNKEGIIDEKNNIKLEFNYKLVQKIQETKLIRTLNSDTNETEIYLENFEKICTMKNANIEKDGSTVKIYNDQETRYFDENGIEINK